MRLTNHSMFALLAVVGCGVNDASDITSGSVLRIEPSTVAVSVNEGVPVSQDYRVIATSPDGTERDVTADTELHLVRPELGFWHVSRAQTSLEVRGAALGQSAIVATYEGVKATASVSVYASSRVVDDAAAIANAPGLFDAGNADSTCFPQISYPEADTILPNNLDGLDVQWVDFRDDVFELTLDTQYAHVEVYTTDFEHAISADTWAQLASTHEPIVMHMAGIAAGSPSVKCTSTNRRIYVTDKPLAGTLYSWADGGGIYRHDVATRGEPEQVTFLSTPASTLPSLSTGHLVQLPTSCEGCAISRDGEQLALRMDDGAGAIFDFTQDQLIKPAATTWQAATFSPLDKLVVVSDGVLRQIEHDGTIVDELANDDGAVAQDPEFSPDGGKLAYVESTGDSGALMVRSFADDGNLWSDASVLVAAQPGVVTASVAWSPDGQWLAFTRTSNGLTSIWAVRADLKIAPIQLTNPTQDAEMAVRWAMSDQTIDGQRFYYLTFDSLRPYGAHDELGRQIWMMAFFPETKLSRPAFHVPFQSRTSNHVSAWTSTLVR